MEYLFLFTLFIILSTAINDCSGPLIYTEVSPASAYTLFNHGPAVCVTIPDQSKESGFNVMTAAWNVPLDYVFTFILLLLLLSLLPLNSIIFRI